MPKGIEHGPKMETKLTAVTLSANGKKIQVFLNLPVINNKSVMPRIILDNMTEKMGLRRGDTYTLG